MLSSPLNISKPHYTLKGCLAVVCRLILLLGGNTTTLSGGSRVKKKERPANEPYAGLLWLIGDICRIPLNKYSVLYLFLHLASFESVYHIDELYSEGCVYICQR